MKKQSNFRALMALVAMGVVFVSCTNVDNPYNTTTPDGKYVMVTDSSVSSTSGATRVICWEHDAEGRFVKEIMTTYAPDGTIDRRVDNYTYSSGLITVSETFNDEAPQIFYYRLNDKGLVEKYEEASGENVLNYEYNADGYLVAITGSLMDIDIDDTFVWKNGDIVSHHADFGVVNYSMNNYEVNFPYLLPCYGYHETALSQMGYYGKATRHLMSKCVTEAQTGVKSGNDISTFDYVVRGGLVVEFAVTEVATLTNGDESKNYSSAERHYLKWKKL